MTVGELLKALEGVPHDSGVAITTTVCDNNNELGWVTWPLDDGTFRTGYIPEFQCFFIDAACCEKANEQKQGLRPY